MALAYDADSRAVLVWQDQDSQGIHLSILPSEDSSWIHQGEVVPEALADELTVMPSTEDQETVFLLAWNSGGAQSSIMNVWTDDMGSPLSDPMRLSTENEGIYRNLHLRPGTGHRASLLASHITDSVEIREMGTSLFLDNDCNGNGIPDQEDIESGEAQDCDENGIPDSCDILSERVSDRNFNHIPDSCEEAFPGDCNANGLTDLDEIFLGLVEDANSNGIPDECELVTVSRTVQIEATATTRFYRASSLRIIDATEDSIELEYRGDIEEADSILGPWSPF